MAHNPHRTKASFTPLQTYKVLKRKKYYRTRDFVLHHYKLTRFSNILFTAFTNCFGFTPLQTYKVLKHGSHLALYASSFTPLQTYKVLKHPTHTNVLLIGFTPLQTYKVLKPQMRLSPSQTYWLICVSYLVMYKTHVFIY